MEHPLVSIAKKRFSEKESQIVHFIDNEEGNLFLNDLDNYPHAYILACLMDRQIKAERAWEIPFTIYKELGFFDIISLEKFGQENYKKLFNKKKLHRFNNTMANIFYNAIIDIRKKYNIGS